jgi:serine/threonine protein phosphatase PrpC
MPGYALGNTGLVVRSGAATHVGRVRPHNEDSVVSGSRVFAVADGMGGHAAGEVASRIAVEALTELDGLPPHRAEDVAGALHAANQRMLDAQAGRSGERGMGTTATGLALLEGESGFDWLAFNVGDSRVYRFAEGRLVQVSRDHSEVQSLLDAGLLGPDEVADHPLRNVITRSLGSDPAPEADVWVLPPTAGERFVLCSDGLSGELDDREIERLVAENDDPQVAAERLVAAAVEAGGHDNVSVVVVAVDAAG